MKLGLKLPPFDPKVPPSVKQMLFVSQWVSPMAIEVLTLLLSVVGIASSTLMSPDPFRFSVASKERSLVP